jgi:hypothetical protein
MLLPKLAVIADTLDRQRIGRLPRAGRLAEGELLRVVCGKPLNYFIFLK